MRILKASSLLLCLTLAGCTGFGDSLRQAWNQFPGGQTKPSTQQGGGSGGQRMDSASASWLSSMHTRMSRAMADTGFHVERRGDAVAVIAMVEGAFNPDRPAMLLPATLRPLTKVAKLAASDPASAVVVLGQADTPDAYASVQGLASQRASSIASIFRLSGMGRDRLHARGVTFSPEQQRHVDARGRVLGRHIEILVMPRTQLGFRALSYNN